MGKLVHIIEEVSFGFQNNPQRVFESTDDGATWTEARQINAYPAAYTSRLLTHSGSLWVGTLSMGEGLIDPSAGLVRSFDGGVTFQGACPGVFGLDSVDSWRTLASDWFTDSIIWAVGKYRAGTSNGWLLKSTDGGATFTLVTTPFDLSFEGVAIRSSHDGRGWFSTDEDGAYYMTTDAGSTWQRRTVPNDSGGPLFAIEDFVHLPGTDTVYALGGYAAEGGPGGDEQRPTMWRSLNGGLSWTHIVDPFAGLTYPPFDPAKGPFQKQKKLLTGIALDATRLVVAMEGNPNYDSFKWFRFSTDAGSTWIEGTFSDNPTTPLIETARPIQGAVADDGSVTISLWTVPVDLADGQVWRGIPGGGGSITWSRTALNPYVYDGCAVLGVVNVLPASEPPPVGEVGRPITIECPPAFAHDICPQLCPTDPIQPGGVMVLPPGLQGFLTWPMPLALSRASGADSVVTYPAMGRPTGCGATFINNLCAQGC